MNKLRSILITAPHTIIIAIRFKIRMERLKNNPNKWMKIYTEKSNWDLFNQFSTSILNSSGYNISLKNESRIQNFNNTVIVVNHKTMFEPALVSHFIAKPLKWIVKKELENNMILSILSKGIKVVSIERNNVAQTSSCLMALTKMFKKGDLIAVCPEGSRSKSETMLPFKEDLFKFFKFLKADILPIKVVYKLSKKNDDGTPNKDMVMVVLEKLKYEDYKELNSKEITAKVFNTMNETH